MDRRELWATRFALQRLVGAPAAGPLEAVAESLAVQSQDAPLTHDSLAQRTGGTAADAAAALDAGRIVRTHVLRPTWHHVAAADVRWLLELTSPKVLSGMRARHRQLGLAEAGDRTPRIDFLLQRVATGPQTRAALAEAFASAGLLDRADPLFWQRLSHVCLIAELEGLVCSGPIDPAGHTYALAERVLPAGAPVPRERAAAELVLRFFASHGPVALKDLQRWTRLTLTEIRAAIGALGDEVDSVDVEGERLWFGARAMAERGPGSAGFAAAAADAAGPWLLSTFDEAVLTHSVLPLPRPSDAHRVAPPKYGEAGGGPAIWNLTHVGAWKRTVKPGRFAVEITPVAPLDAGAEAGLRAAASALARRAGHPDAVVTIR